jgi:predicted Rossmann fold nucleotide-binding protein DprA/Smf involved in DNA uptake
MHPKRLAAAALEPESNGLPATASMQAAGNLELLSTPKLGLMCSSQCPGSIVLKTYDLVRDLRDQGTVMVGGFHSPMEKECLGILLRGHQPIVICPARYIDGMFIPREWAQAYEEQRLLVISGFGPKDQRVTRAKAETRNRLVAALGKALVVPHAAPNSKTLALCKEVLAGQYRVLTFADPANEELIQLGARPIEVGASGAALANV